MVSACCFLFFGLAVVGAGCIESTHACFSFRTRFFSFYFLPHYPPPPFFLCAPSLDLSSGVVEFFSFRIFSALRASGVFEAQRWPGKASTITLVPSAGELDQVF